MTSIKSIRIKNFQSHEDTFLDFSEGLNVIVGPSDSGKSAVIRALKWVLFNEPRGMDFIRQGSTGAKVTIELNNGCSIERERSRSKNRYTVVNADGSVNIFEGFGNEVPEEVVKAHGIPRVILDSDLSSSLNISDQLEGPFLLSETASVRAKAIGRLTGLHVIDRAIRECMVDLRRENQSSERIKLELDETDIKLAAYENLPKLGARINECEILLGRMEKTITRMERLEEAKDTYQHMETEYSRVENELKALAHLNEIELNIKKCEVDANKLKTVEKMKASLKKTERGLFETGGFLEKTKGVESAGSILKELESKKSRFARAAQIYKSLNEIENERKKAGTVLDKTADITKYERIAGALVEKTELLGRLNDLYKRYRDKETVLEQAGIFLEKTGDTDRCAGILKSVNAAVERLNGIEELKEQYGMIMNYISEGQKFLLSNKKETGRLLEEYGVQLKKLGRCPFCKSEISVTVMAEILKHYEEGNC